MSRKGFERNADELRKARNQMANLVNSGQVSALDRMGIPIKVGDLAIVHLTPDPILQVLAVKPQMDPRAPADQVTVIFGLQFPMHVRAGLPVSNVVIVGSNLREDVVEEPEPAVADAGAADPAAATGPRLVLTDTPEMPASAEERPGERP